MTNNNAQQQRPDNLNHVMSEGTSYIQEQMIDQVDNDDVIDVDNDSYEEANNNYGDVDRDPRAYVFTSG